jgi:hypothetical protein
VNSTISNLYSQITVTSVGFFSGDSFKKIFFAGYLNGFYLTASNLFENATWAQNISGASWYKVDESSPLTCRALANGSVINADCLKANSNFACKDRPQL